ncbi:MAG TPA: YkvA family protein [Flavipsychrobacter sp.]|nr:YkvA family protein [Flavipsychrobacter sp.]
MSRVIPTREMKTMRHATHLFSNRRTLWQMLRAVFTGNYRMSMLTTAIVILCLAYIISPVDIIPDVFLLFGWIDDGFIFYLLLKRLNVETKNYIRFKVMERKHGNF